MTEPATYYLILRLKKWEDITFTSNMALPPAKLQPPENEVGYIPVFKTREAALEAAGDESLIMEIREVTPDDPR